MPRALFATIAMLAFSTGLCFAQDGSDANQHSQPTPKFVSAQSSPTSLEDSAAEQELLELANQRRRDAGAPPLRMDATLSNAARAHARLMVERQELSHQFDGEPSLMPRLLETGLRLDRVGENVAYNASVEKAFEALMQSPPHRRNLLDPSYNSAGFAAFWSNQRLYVVQDFAHQLPSISKTSLP
jgi:uncharacterized protein YkwD